MAEKTLITLTSPEGATLNTAGKYCDKDIEIVPNLQEKVATESGIVTADEGCSGLKSVDTTPVYEAGKKAEYDAFWDAYQYNGFRDVYAYAFAGIGWTKETFNPKYSIVATNAYHLFQNSYANLNDIYTVLDEKGLVLDFSMCTTADAAFYGCYIEKLRRLDFTSLNSASDIFSYSSRLHTIEALVIKETTKFFNLFIDCSVLTNLIIEGTIGQNGFNVQWSKSMSHDSLMSIINALKDYSEDTSGTDWLVTIGSENKAKLTEDEILIAENKGWRLA